MSKGRRPRKSKGPQPILTIREVPSQNTPVIDVIPDILCWEFNLVDTTQVAISANVGDLVFGVVHSDQIAIHTVIGLIGFVPLSVTQKIIEAIKQYSMSELQGTITNKGGEAKVGVKLCLM